MSDSQWNVPFMLRGGRYKTIAMVGPNANASMNLLSGYHGSPPFLVSPVAAMRAKIGEAAVSYSVGCNVSDVDNRGIATPAAVVQAAIAAAIKTANAADITVLGLGATTRSRWFACVLVPSMHSAPLCVVTRSLR